MQRIDWAHEAPRVLFLLAFSVTEVVRNALTWQAIRNLAKREGAAITDFDGPLKNRVARELWHGLEKAGRFGWVAAILFYFYFESIHSTVLALLLGTWLFPAALVVVGLWAAFALLGPGIEDSLTLDCSAWRVLWKDVLLALVAAVLLFGLWYADLSGSTPDSSAPSGHTGMMLTTSQ